MMLRGFDLTQRNIEHVTGLLLTVFPLRLGSPLASSSTSYSTTSIGGTMEKVSKQSGEVQLRG